MTLAALDVHYTDPAARAACVLFTAWTDAIPVRELTARVDVVAPYEPGAFYKRELPCLRAVLSAVGEPLETIVIDGYVWLGDREHPGLGAHLFDALGRKVPVIGVAKTAFRDTRSAVAVERGTGHTPLFVTSVGVDLDAAVAHVRSMHGAHRIPTLLARVDRLCRGR